MGTLEGRTVIVTGASSGIGRAIARRCLQEGAAVIAAGRRREALEELSDDGPAVVFTGDLREPATADELVATAQRETGRLDGVAHAAGTVLRNEDPRDTSDETLADVLEVNLVAPFRLARAALRPMTAQGGGSIVLLSSQLAFLGLPGYASYSAAKGGVSALVRTLCSDAGPSGVRVNAVAPGLVRTPMAYVGRDNFDELVPGIAERHPLRRIGEPEDIAGPVVFLLGDDADWITGQTLIVDGGFTVQ